MNSSRWPSWANAALLLIASFITIASLSLQVRPGSEIVAASFPPWWSAQQSLAAAAMAGAAIVRQTGIPSLIVVRPGDDTGMARLRQAGAWFLIDPVAVGGCLPDEARTRP